MRIWRIFVHRIYSLFRRSRAEAELQREIDLHVDQLTREFAASGMREGDAHMAALREFGGTEAIKERCRDMRRVNTVEDLFRDLAYAFRLAVKSPGFTLTAVVSLALGIGANTAVFSLLDAAMLKRLAVRNPDTLRILTWVRNDKVPMAVQSGYWMRDARTGLNVTGSFPYPAYRLFRSTISEFSDVMASAPIPNQFTVTADGISEYANGDFVSGNYFTGLGVQPLIGVRFCPRTMHPTDRG